MNINSRLVAACALSIAALGTATACSGKAQVAPSAVNHAAYNRSASPTATPTQAAATATPGATHAPVSTTTSTNTSSGGTTVVTPASVVPACGNNDLRINWGYGTESQPLQFGAVIFKNVSAHTCTLQGYPGAVIKDGGTTINAARVLNGDPGVPKLSSPPLVTLKPGGAAHAELEWLLYTNQSCYPTGSGTFEITAPNTTKTVTISTGAHLGKKVGICSAFETNPVVPGTLGFTVGN